MSTDPDTPSSLSRFLAEMKRRHVARFAFGYAAAAFVVLQLGEIVLPAFGLGEEWLRLLVIAVAIGFPPAVLLAWIFDITPHGLRRTEEPPAPQAITPVLPRLALTALTLLVVGGLSVWLSGAVGTAELDPTGAGPLRAADLDDGRAITSLAVLPFRDESPPAERQEYLTAGMQEELITRLGQIPGLRVVSRTSTERYRDAASGSMPEVGRELGVDAVIEGALLRVGDQVRINVALYHAAEERRLWGDSFSAMLDDVFALQSDVALEIARAVQGQVSPEDESMIRRTAARDVAPGAADAYLRGRWEADKGTPEGYRAAMGLFEEALEEDSSFAPALAGLAGSRLLLSLESREARTDEVARARREAIQALEIDSSSWEAREILGSIERSFPAVGRGGDDARTVEVRGTPGIVVQGPDTAWLAAMSHLGQRIQVQVHRRLATVGAARGQLAAAARQLVATGHFEEAAELLEEVVDEDPDDVGAWEMLAHAAILDGDAGDAVEVVDDWAATGAAGAPSPEEAEQLEEAVDRDGAAAFWRWTAARLAAARRDGRPVSLTLLATAEAGLGRADRAFATLAEALARGEPGVVGVRTDPTWDDLRDDPRLAAILREARAAAAPRAGVRSRPPRPPGG